MNLRWFKKKLLQIPNLISNQFKQDFISSMRRSFNPRVVSFSDATRYGAVHEGGLSVGIHIVVVALIVAGEDVVRPRLVVEVPLHGLLDAFLKLQARLPAKLAV